ncbi:hypothetical protein CBW65_04405 [Tumebacillus avium]|uniref:ABC transporter ATP-binding protein n=2 Tax=Tumebacillus avium TaxID=1903704 RepID=A0A1Y0IIR3_9BACL|nr:hypothetical protein CBW65_04405 [Tumebacillus avium]
MPYKRKLFGVIAFGLIATLSELAIPKFIQHIIDVVLIERDFAGLWEILFIIAGLVVVIVAVKAVRNLLQRQVIERASSDSQHLTFQHLRNLGVSYFERNAVGEILSFMNTQMTAVQQIYRQYLPVMIEQTVFAVVSFIFMMQISLKLTLFVIPCFLIYYLFGPWFERKAATFGRNSSQGLRELNQKIYESLAAMPEIRAFASEQWEMERLHAAHRFFRSTYMKYVLFAWLRGTFRRLSYYLGAIGIFLYGAYLVQHNDLSTGEFVAFILYYFAGMHILTAIVTAVTEQQLLIYQIEPLHQFIYQKPEVVEPIVPIELESIRGEIIFSNVHFGYSDRQPILKGFDMRIRVGERVALVGKSGEGKTTLLKLIGRFYDPTAGEVYLDGVPLQKLSFAQLRNAIGFVFQETYLFNTSIKENIRFGNPEATEEEVIEAAKAANCHEFIMKLEHGYDTHIGERGFKLSGGQKQRISIARLFIKNPSIVVLDEATSALDNISESKVKEALDRLFAGRTVIAIAHRLSTIRDYDNIVFVGQGKNLEMGNFEDLMEQQGHFYQMVSGIHEDAEVIA